MPDISKVNGVEVGNISKVDNVETGSVNTMLSGSFPAQQADPAQTSLTNIDFESGRAFGPSAAFDTTNSVMAFAYGDDNNSDYPSVTCATASGTTLTFGDTAPSADHKATGVVVSIASGESVTAFNAVYIRSDGEVGPADADAATSMPAIGVALESKSDGQATKILISGVLRDDTYNFTPGADLFIGTTAGEITATAPSGSGDTVQKIGVALSADSIYVNFNTTEVLLA